MRGEELFIFNNIWVDPLVEPTRLTDSPPGTGGETPGILGLHLFRRTKGEDSFIFNYFWVDPLVELCGPQAPGRKFGRRLAVGFRSASVLPIIYTARLQ